MKNFQFQLFVLSLEFVSVAPGPDWAAAVSPNPIELPAGRGLVTVAVDSRVEWPGRHGAASDPAVRVSDRLRPLPERSAEWPRLGPSLPSGPLALSLAESCTGTGTRHRIRRRFFGVTITVKPYHLPICVGGLADIKKWKGRSSRKITCRDDGQVVFVLIFSTICIGKSWHTEKKQDHNQQFILFGVCWLCFRQLLPRFKQCISGVASTSFTFFLQSCKKMIFALRASFSSPWTRITVK